MQPYDIYELMITPPNKKGEMIISELREDEPNLNLVRDLVVLGANLEWKGVLGFTALHYCAYHNHIEIARMLIDGGADVNVQDDDGRTALHVCTWTTDPEIARVLVDAGADKTIRDNRGKLPYDLTINSEFLKLLKV